MSAPARFECRICWYVYAPAAGDDVRQVEPGTPFAGLPEAWSCPNCEVAQSQFLAMEPD